MTTILLYRDSVLGRRLACSLAEHGLVSALVVERPHKARSRKLARTVRSAKWWQLPFRAVDLLAVAIYSGLVNRQLRRTIEVSPVLPPEVPALVTADVNETTVVEWICRYEPDALVVYGTSILKDHLIHLPRKYALNIHGGILPQYRNVHSDFWALARHDYAHLGATIVHLDSGVDTGDIALQRTIQVEPGDTIVSVKRKIADVAQDLIVEALERAVQNALPRAKQNPGASGYYRTPTARQLLTFVANRRYRIGESAYGA